MNSPSPVWPAQVKAGFCSITCWCIRYLLYEGCTGTLVTTPLSTKHALVVGVFILGGTLLLMEVVVVAPTCVEFDTKGKYSVTHSFGLSKYETRSNYETKLGLIKLRTGSD